MYFKLPLPRLLWILTTLAYPINRFISILTVAASFVIPRGANFIGPAGHAGTGQLALPTGTHLCAIFIDVRFTGLE